MTPTTSPILVVPPGAGRTLVAFADEAQFHLTGADTGGQFTLLTNITPPGGGPPVHHHDNEDEAFYVLEGRVSFFFDGQWTEVKPGTVVYAPRGSVHTFKNVGDTPSKLLVKASPSGFENFFAELSDECARPGGPDMERAMAIGKAHGIHFAPPPQ